MKQCAGCKKWKPITDYTEYNCRKGYKWPRCKPCLRAYFRARYHKLSEAQKRERKLRAVYGITLEAYTTLLEEQKGGCAICKESTLENLHVDHSHTSQKVRGLLCGKCNRGLGLYKDDPNLLRAAADYLERHSNEY